MNIETLIAIRNALVSLGADAETLAMMDQAIDQARNAQNLSTEQMEDAYRRGAEAARNAAREVVGANNEAISSARASAQSYRELSAALGELGDTFDEERAALDEMAAGIDRSAAGAESATQMFEAQARRMGLNREMTDSFTGSLIQAGSLGFTALAQSMREMVQPQALFASGLAAMESATMSLAKKFDAQQAELAKATGTSGEYNDMMYEMQETNRSFNVDVEAAAKAIEGLHTNMASFSSMNSDTQAQLATTSARMEALGVSGEKMGQQFDAMIMGMGMSADMANEASLELVNLGDQIGVAASVISEDFAQASSELAKYGPEAIDVFKGMAAAAKATGIEVAGLMQVAGQFDTFEGAAEGAGKLNAILGGGVINSMDLLNGTEEERIRLLIESMQASGKNFESLNRFEKQAIANAAGIKDMSEANKLFSMSLSAYDEMQSKAGAASAEQAKLEERAQAATKFADKLEQIGQAFAVAFMPILDFLHGFANMILSINDMTGGLFIPVMVALTGVVYFLGGGFSSLAGSLMTTGTSAPPAALGLQSIIPPLTQLAILAYMAGPAILGLGMAILGLGLALAAPLGLIAAIVVSFTQLFMAMMEAPKAIAAAVAGMVGFAIGAAAAMVIMAMAIAQAVTILVPFAAQMMLVAPGLAAFGAAALVAVLPFILLGKALKSMAEGLMAFKDVGFSSLVMAALSIAMFAAIVIPLAAQMGIGAFLVGAALMVFGKGLQSFAQGLVEFNNVGIGAMFMALGALGLFAIAIKPLATQIFIGGAKLGFGLMILGAGLKSFGKGLQIFNKITGAAIVKMLGTLAGMAFMLKFLTVELLLGGIGVGIGLLILGKGLLSFAIGIKKFNRVGIKAITMMLLSLGAMALALKFLTGPLFIAGLLVGGPLMLIGEGLQEFGKGVKRFNKVTGMGIVKMMVSLAAVAVGLVGLGPLLILAGVLVGGPLMLIGLGLQHFAKGIKKFNAVAVGAIAMAMASLIGMAVALIVAAPMFLGMLAVGASLLLFGMGLKAFARGIRKFNSIGGKEIAVALASLFSFAIGLWLMTPWLLGMAATMLVVAIPLMAFGYALTVFAKGLKAIGKSADGLMMLANAMSMLMLIGLTGALGFAAIGAAIMGIAFALMFIPEKKAVALGFTLDGYARAMQAVSALTPESVEAANQVVEAAGKYVEIQAEMKMPAADAFVAAMSSVFGGDSGDKGGQDIVLKVNGREFARAVDVAINKSHNLKMD